MTHNSQALTFNEINIFLEGSGTFEFKSNSREERNKWIQEIITQYKYRKCTKPKKSILRKYILKICGISRQQLSRLIKEYYKRGTLKPKEFKRNCFERIYTKGDIELLAKVDNAHSKPTGQSIIKIMQDDYTVSGELEYERLKDISVGHLYRLRSAPRYRENAKAFSKTKPTSVNIGERRKPEPNGKLGYLCVDTVHQGDLEGEKGVYHINIVDMVTQFEFVGAVEAISESHMRKILDKLITFFPYDIVEIHSDNGSEYINKVVAKLLDGLLIKLTKTRPRHSNDNALAETKNGAIIRKHMGYIHIPKNKANLINEFYDNYFNTYINYHRPSAFPEIIVDKKGKERRVYPQKNYMTPYQKLKLLVKNNDVLKDGVNIEDLDKIAHVMSHTKYAELMQEQKQQLFNKIRS